MPQAPQAAAIVPTEEHPHRVASAVLVLASGLGSAIGIVLFARKRYHEAWGLALTAAVTGSFIGAARTLGGK